MIKNNLDQSNNKFTSFKKELKKIFVNIFTKLKKNKLILSIIYSFDLLTNKELETFYNFFESSKSKDKKIVFVMILNSLLSYLSFKISYNFKHMINKCITNNKPSLHIIYGETISQLASFCIGIEANNILLNCNLINNELKNKLIDNAFIINLNEDLSFANFDIINETNQKQILKNDLQRKFEKIVNITNKNILLI